MESVCTCLYRVCLKKQKWVLIKLAVSHVYVGGLGKSLQFKLKRGVGAFLKAKRIKWEMIVRRVYGATA